MIVCSMVRFYDFSQNCHIVIKKNGELPAHQRHRGPDFGMDTPVLQPLAVAFEHLFVVATI